MRMSKDIVNALNIISDWLAVDDFTESQEIEAELVIIAGHAVIPNIIGALNFASDAKLPLLVSGGVGHSTDLLRHEIERNVITAGLHIETQGKSEAEIIASLATRLFNIPQENIYIERASTNCGANANLSSKLIVDHGMDVKCAILVQDPLMQRRTYESFIYSWSQNNLPCTFINWPVFSPRLVIVSGKPQIIGGHLPGTWTIERYVSMILGEIKRLHDDADGYGPKGAGFIGHVDIPDTVLDAWDYLKAHKETSEMTR
ncbi:ElyC/SanA/YdcF family protein [Pectobacterium carotovorum]|uniref:YdcF family protein n=1 Tax=Pectobacterium carotovorum TaxID=554 RepID=UPI0029D6CDB5|nr:ElyC/SanA/YdcF family protein [Pectobacterium carotovorum]MDX6914906.1 ElyC/SanA/YdcF family protein [Pectobacterium carotovorum]